MNTLNPFNHRAGFSSQCKTGLKSLVLTAICTMTFAAESTGNMTAPILSRVAAHEFHPIRDGFTYDRDLNKHGVASLEDQDWRVRTLAVRDLVRFATSRR